MLIRCKRYMDFMYKSLEGSAYQLHFTHEKGICLSPFKKYKALVLDGVCVSWCEADGKLEWGKILDVGQEYYHIAISNIDCWDLLQILEDWHNETEEMMMLCYRVSRELTDDQNGLSEDE